jgi:hypothetical protein
MILHFASNRLIFIARISFLVALTDLQQRIKSLSDELEREQKDQETMGNASMSSITRFSRCFAQPIV